MGLKHIWSTPHGAGLLSISFESANAEEAHQRITIAEGAFPAKPNKKYPLRHTINIGLFDEDDINMIAQCFDQLRTDK